MLVTLDGCLDSRVCVLGKNITIHKMEGKE